MDVPVQTPRVQVEKKGIQRDWAMGYFKLPKIPPWPCDCGSRRFWCPMEKTKLGRWLCVVCQRVPEGEQFRVIEI